MDVNALGVSQLSDRPCYSSQTDQCYSSVLLLSFIQKIKGKYRREGMPTQKTRRGERERACAHGRERPQALWLLFLYVAPPSPGPALCKLGQPGVLFVVPEVLTPVLGPSFVLFLRAFPFLVFQPPPFWTPFSYSNYLTLAIHEHGILTGIYLGLILICQ